MGKIQGSGKVDKGALPPTCPKCKTYEYNLKIVRCKDGSEQIGAFCNNCAAWIKWVDKSVRNLSEAKRMPTPKTLF